MARVAKAAQQLLDQVGGQVVGDPDGFGVHRSVSVPAEEDMRSILRDHRVRGICFLDSGTLVTFVAGTAADSTEPFDL